MKYPVIIWKAADAFSAEMPDLPGVIITEANSLDALLHAIEEAAAGWMEAELAEGRSIPLPSDPGHLAAKEEYRDGKCVLLDIVSDEVDPRQSLARLTRGVKDKVRFSGLSQDDLDRIIADGIAWSRSQPR